MPRTTREKVDPAVRAVQGTPGVVLGKDVGPVLTEQQRRDQILRRLNRGT
jgi:hypothetical protein